ncbi:MAG: hypothetical protein ACXQS8_07250 [Candidatus Helarchaeales archaeon]
MGEYIVSVNSKWQSNDFPSSSVAKTLLKVFKEKQTRFPIIHKMVKTILKNWEAQGICDHISTTKYAHCRKTKEIYRFDDEGFKKLKELILDRNIQMIKKDDKHIFESFMAQQNRETMKSRESIINNFLMDLHDEILQTASENNPLFDEEEDE